MLWSLTFTLSALPCRYCKFPLSPLHVGLPDPSWFYRSLSAGPSASRRSLHQDFYQYWKRVQIRDGTINFHFPWSTKRNWQASQHWVCEEGRGSELVKGLGSAQGCQTLCVWQFQTLSKIDIYWKNSSLRYNIHKADVITVSEVMMITTEVWIIIEMLILQSEWASWPSLIWQHTQCTCYLPSFDPLGSLRTFTDIHANHDLYIL